MNEQEKGLELHHLIILDDPISLAKLYDMYGQSILVALRYDFQELAKTDQDLFLHAINDAFLGYYKKPTGYQASLGTLKSFLIRAAKGDLLNLIEKDSKHKGKLSLSNVEVPEERRNELVDNSYSTDEQLIRKETTYLINDELSKYFTSESDISLAKMIISGERKTDAYANLLELGTLEKKEREAAVKRNKDRVIKVLQRNQVELKLKALLQ